MSNVETKNLISENATEEMKFELEDIQKMRERVGVRMNCLATTVFVANRDAADTEGEMMTSDNQDELINLKRMCFDLRQALKDIRSEIKSCVGIWGSAVTYGYLGDIDRWLGVRERGLMRLVVVLQETELFCFQRVKYSATVHDTRVELMEIS